MIHDSTKEAFMSSSIGIWLDRSNAVIISLASGKSETITLSSDIQKARHPPKTNLSMRLTE
jgi:hypothetical protein